MTNDDIRRLLGGYATNTLTEAERKALLDAALEDQNLFDALHQEQALKDLLDDPISRDDILRALEKPAPQTAWWSRWWTWAGAASAAAAAVLTFAVVHSRAPEAGQQIVVLKVPAASAPAPIHQEVPSDSTLKTPRNARAQLAHDSKKTSAQFRPPSIHVGTGSAGARPRASAVAATTEPVTPPPPPPAAPSQQVQVQAQATTVVPSQSQSDQAAAPVVNSLRAQEQKQSTPGVAGGAVSGAFLRLSVAPVRFALLKRDDSGTYQPLAPDAGLSTGDSVRLTVTPAMPGYLSLSRQGPSGEWTLLFPESPVSANATYTIPDAPIGVTDSYQKLRITLVAEPAGRAKSRAKVVNAPFVVDLTIGPKK